ncbi:thermonuclease family protein [Guggenheimella bovis]
MKKKLLSLLLAVVLVLGIFPTSVMAAPKKVTIDPKATYKVEKIIDGDSIVVRVGKSKVNVQLLYADAPEYRHPIKKLNGLLGKDAFKFTEKFLKGKKVSLVLDKDSFDKSGTVFAYVYVKDKCLNAELIKAHLAKVGDKTKNEKFYKDYVELEKAAKDPVLGIWKDLKANYPVLPTGPVHANKASKIYHMPYHSSYDRISKKNLVIFKTEAEAIKAGYRKAKR